MIWLINWKFVQIKNTHTRAHTTISEPNISVNWVIFDTIFKSAHYNCYYSLVLVPSSLCTVLVLCEIRKSISGGNQISTDYNRALRKLWAQTYHFTKIGEKFSFSIAFENSIHHGNGSRSQSTYLTCENISLTHNLKKMLYKLSNLLK